MLSKWEQYITLDADAIHRYERENAAHFRYNDDALATIADRDLEVWRIIEQMTPNFRFQTIDGSGTGGRGLDGFLET